MSHKNKIYWCSRGWQPHYFGFCPTKKAWDRMMAERKLTADYPDTDGCVTTFSGGKLDHPFSLVTITDKKMGTAELVGMLVHEAAHVWQEILYQIGEKKPSPEFEAYSMQAIVQELITGWNQTGRGKIG